MLAHKKRASRSFYKLLFTSWLAIVPVVGAILFASYCDYKGMVTSVEVLDDISKFNDKILKIPPLMMTQEQATVSMVMDPETMFDVSERKIEAYDKTIELINGIHESSPNHDIRDLISSIKKVDEEKVQPLESMILEMLFEDLDLAKKTYLTDYQKYKLEFQDQMDLLIEKIAALSKDRLNLMMFERKRDILMNTIILSLSLFLVMMTLYLLSKKIYRGEDDLFDLLASLSEGLFYFDKDGKISSKRSDQLMKVLPGSEDVTTLQDLFPKYAQGFSAKSIDSVLSLLWPDSDDDGFFSSFLDTCSMLPQKLYFDHEGNQQTIIQLRYHPIYRKKKGQEDELYHVVVGVTDITDKMKMQREQEQQAKRIERIQKASSNIEAFKLFLKDAIKLFKHIDGFMYENNQCQQLDRDFHTLKGNLAMFGFSDIGEKIHQIEEVAEKAACQDCHKVWDVIKDQWKYETSDIESVIGLRNFENRTLVDNEKIEKLKIYVSKHPELSKKVRNLQTVSISQVFQKYTDLIEKLNTRGSKKAQIFFDEESDEVLFDEIARIDNCLVHVIRNCFDHGIEDEETRVDKGKHRVGRILISCFRRQDDSLHMILKDDGQGINTDKIYQMAKDKGILTPEEQKSMSDEERVYLIFKDSLSSKEQATDLSGRGVGMSAVLAQIEEIGGKISVFSHPGQGTQFEIDLPTFEGTPS